MGSSWWQRPGGRIPNAEVGMPIFSVSNVAKDQHRVVFDDDGGHVIHKPTGNRFDFIIASGVYALKMGGGQSSPWK